MIQYVPADSASTVEKDDATDVAEPESNHEHARSTRKNIVIDVGKTFKAAACRFFPEHGVTELDAIVREFLERTIFLIALKPLE